MTLSSLIWQNPQQQPVVFMDGNEEISARGDDIRSSQPDEATRPAEVPRPLSNALLWLFFLIVTIVHVLFIKTFPLNNRGGDAPGYFRLITNFKSNLCYAPGYLFLAGLPFSIPPIGAVLRSHPHGLDMAFLFAQHAFDLLCLGILMVVLARTFSRTTAFIAVALAGLSLDGLAVTSSVYPEWLQGDLLMLALVFVCLAWRSTKFIRKSFWYALAYVAFTWTYFVKFNALVFFPLLLLPILLEKTSWRMRIQLLAIALVFAFINYGLFVGLYHWPKTGTRSLSYDHSWVLMGRLEQVYGPKQLPYPEGIATKRWLALSAVLPPNYEYAGDAWFDNVNTVTEETREPYRKIATHLLTCDEAELNRFLSTHPLPETFKLGVSSIPISYWVGLKVSDELGTKVYFESVLHRPRPFIKDVVKATANTLLERRRYPLFPLPEDVAAYHQTITPIDRTHFRLTFEPESYRTYDYDVFRKDDPLIWTPGYKLFSAIYDIALPNKALLAIIMFGFFGALLLSYIRGWTFQTATVLALTINLLGFVVSSSIVAPVRWKEIRLALPVVAILVGITCGYILPELLRTVTLMLAARKARTKFLGGSSAKP